VEQGSVGTQKGRLTRKCRRIGGYGHHGWHFKPKNSLKRVSVSSKSASRSDSARRPVTTETCVSARRRILDYLPIYCREMGKQATFDGISALVQLAVVEWAPVHAGRKLVPCRVVGKANFKGGGYFDKLRFSLLLLLSRPFTKFIFLPGS
jgi:hypothetical protein